MKAITASKKWLIFAHVFLGAMTFGSCVSHNAFAQSQAQVLSQSPLFQSVPVTPIMMLNMSRDHQLFFKVYDDYADITGDGIPDRTYINSYDYYGYFDSAKCYVYNTTRERFEPSRLTTNHYCNQIAGSNEWSGNFLNWATMTRMDAVRKILYGGYRSTDDNNLTVLERAFLPHDAHSFAKYYNGSDLTSLVPFNVTTNNNNTQASGITFCNTTHAAAGKSQDITLPPLVRVAKGNYSLWASNETWQCYWRSEKVTDNANNPLTSGIFASAANPPDADKQSVTNLNAAHLGDYYVRVKVCDSSLLGNETCTQYGTNYKPTGLLQTYGEETQADGKALINFGLITGTYGANKSGGVVRKNVGSMRSEIDPSTGVFTGADGIVKTLNKLRIFGYDYGSGGYTGTTASDDNCIFDKSGFANGQCSNWGNPQSEIYLESLRYLAGKSPTQAFNVDDSARIAGLTKVSSWVDPLNNANYCAPLNIIQFNASSSSYDADQLTSDLGIANVNSVIDLIGNALHENLSGNYYIGENGTSNDQLCTPKTAATLSAVKGTCPDSPRLQGGYGIAGLAYYARINDLRTTATNNNLTGSQTVRTFGVSLAPAVPSITIKDPNAQSTKQVTILPACKNLRTSTYVNGLQNQTATSEGNCGLVDFKIVSQNVVNNVARGSLYINWEAAEAGGDYDQDMWGMLNYEVNFSTNVVSITTRVYYQSSARPLGFGYVISGTTNDGFKVHSGINDFSGPAYPNCLANDNCTCNANNSTGACTELANTAARTYTIGTSTAKFLQPPLYYAAKWGGFTDYIANGLDKTAADYESRLANIVKDWNPTGRTYFYATDPRTLEESLKSAMSQISAQKGSATSVATNSTKLNGDIALYQAGFTSVEWSGQVKAYKLNANGTVSSDLLWSTDTAAGFPTSDAGRKIYTYNGSSGVEFTWSNLSSAQQNAFRGTDSVADAQKKLNWVRGQRTNEGVGGLRERTRTVTVNGVDVQRTRLLGDVVNSDPSYSGGNNLRYGNSSVAGADSYADYVNAKKSRAPMLYVGANDGMLHALNATTGAEVFAYVPSAVLSKLAATAKSDYGQEFNPHRYLVDGPSYTADVYDGSSWKTILVGTMGAGGKGIFVLDVTDPEHFDGTKVLYEYGASDSDDIGYIFSPVQIVPLNDGTWNIVFGNGYQSVNNKSVLFAINVFNKSSVKKIDTGAVGGLSGPAVLANAQRITETAYAGDLAGNMWKFDLSSSTRANWDVAFKSGVTPLPLVKVMSSTDVAQPITGTPTIGYRAESGAIPKANMIYFGTGEYIFEGDEALTTRQTFYAIADELVSSPSPLTLTVLNRETLLHKKSITSQTTNSVTHRSVRATDEETNRVDWATKKGWFLDLIPPNTTDNGERVISKPILVYDRIIFPTLISSQDACAAGGDSWLMELTAVGNMYNGYHVFDDRGVQTDAPIMSLSEVITAGDNLYIPTSDADENINIFKGNTPGNDRGRYSWRQLR